MPKEWTDCVASLIKSGTPKDSAYAICTAQYKKKHGKPPQRHEELSVEEKALLDDFLDREEEIMGKDIQKYDRKFKMPSRALSTCVTLPVKLAEDDFEKEKTVKIQIMREGKWEHPMYGKLEFNQKKFRKFIRNFNLNIPQEHIAYDFKHRPDWGAAAWVKKFHSSGDKFFATVELTPRGYKSLKEREFIYFSTEFTDEYQDYETGTKHGPCILGGGLTNRPFIKDMDPVLLSEDGTEQEFSPLSEDRKEVSDPMLKELMKKLQALGESLKKLSEGDVTKEDLTAATDSFNEVEQEFAAIKPEDLKAEENSDAAEKLEALGESVKKLGEQISEVKDAESIAGVEKYLKKLEGRFEKLELKEKTDGDNKPLSEENEALKATNAKLSEDVEKLNGSVKELGESIKALQKKNEANDKRIYEGSIEAFKKELSADGLWPSVVEECSAVLHAYEGRGTTVVTLSEDVTTGEGDEKKTEKVESKLSLQDIIRRILSAIPEEGRVNLSENTKGAGGEKPGENKMLSVEEIEGIAKEREKSYGETLVELSMDPKYKDRIDLGGNV